jgi:hypothetical protein
LPGLLEDSQLVDSGFSFSQSDPGWECKELAVAAKHKGDSLVKNGPVAQGHGNDQELDIHAKFMDPLEKALRYQRATARDFYTALRLLLKLRTKRDHDLPLTRV